MIKWFDETWIEEWVEFRGGWCVLCSPPLSLFGRTVRFGSRLSSRRRRRNQFHSYFSIPFYFMSGNECDSDSQWCFPESAYLLSTACTCRTHRTHVIPLTPSVTQARCILDPLIFSLSLFFPRIPVSIVNPASVRHHNSFPRPSKWWIPSYICI